MKRVACKYWPYSKQRSKSRSGQTRWRNLNVFKCRATYVLWVIWDAEFDGDTHLKYNPRKGQFQVKIGKIRSNFKIQNFLTKTCLSYAELSQNLKNIIYFYVRQLEMQKKKHSKMWRHDLYLFFLAIAQPKTKILLRNFVSLLVVCISITHIPVCWITSKFRIL